MYTFNFKWLAHELIFYAAISIKTKRWQPKSFVLGALCSQPYVCKRIHLQITLNPQVMAAKINIQYLQSPGSSRNTWKNAFLG